MGVAHKKLSNIVKGLIMHETVILSVVCALLGSGCMGFLQFMIARHDEKENEEEDKLDGIREMLIGLGHDRIIWLGSQYIKKGYITKEEYTNLNDYLYIPYANLGGNGTAKKVMDEVRELPLKEK